ncbi:uncharacterized protein LOC144620943 [Crassostrea virginica]
MGCSETETRNIGLKMLISVGLAYLLILFKVLKLIYGGSFSCSVSIETVVLVPSCPGNEEEWRKAAKQKNCPAYASKCDNPDKLMYHCVVNEYVNETLEVCAIQQNIVGGYCTEYNRRGNVIQLNYNRKCDSRPLALNPCPKFYLSNETFKYPLCYKLVMTSRPSTESATISSSTNLIEFDNSENVTTSNMDM